MKRKSLIGIIVVLVVAVFVGIVVYVHEKNNEEEKEVDKFMSRANLPYSISGSLSLAFGPKDIEKMIGKADVIRKFDDTFYEIRTMQDDSILFIVYNKNANTARDVWRLKKLIDVETINTLVTKKSSLEDVLLIDPYTNLSIASAHEAISEHRLKDNKSAIIKYAKNNELWIVSEIKINDPDPSGFTSLLLPEDFKLIS